MSTAGNLMRMMMERMMRRMKKPPVNLGQPFPRLGKKFAYVKFCCLVSLAEEMGFSSCAQYASLNKATLE